MKVRQLGQKEVLDLYIQSQGHKNWKTFSNVTKTWTMGAAEFQRQRRDAMEYLADFVCGNFIVLGIEKEKGDKK